ncbi:hypothetical protein [Lacinutrix algicola]|uniref:hypothetical protein n=1 Tax=Lacinutrix algicola TaxID=342954 RepID=UPI0006E2BE4B|nr:hypothetical protein [Lacinutrix algicola]
MTTKEKSNIQESLSTLYLRLNGYLTTSFIIHHSEKKISGELDILGLRFPNHSQDDTEHNSSEFLEIPKTIDLVVAEIKSNGKSVQFNKPLRQEQNAVEVWTKILKWIGILDNQEIENIVPELIDLVQTKENSKLANLKSSRVLHTKFGLLSIRPILFSPERIDLNNADKLIGWTEINDFIWKCLCPNKQRDECGTRYDFTAWGTSLFEIVKVYKDRQKSQKKLETINELYVEIEKLRN